MLLYYITDRSQFEGDETARWAALLERIRAAAEAGVDFIQLRERDLVASELESLAREVATCVAGTKSRLLINHRVDVAIAAGAAGVHLRSGPGEISVKEAQEIFKKAGVARPVIAVSCHTQDEVAAAAADQADFIVFGPVYGKANRSGAGLPALREACASSSVPVLALGGVNAENAANCLRAGAAGVAGIRLFQGGEIARAVASLRAFD